MPTIDQLQAAVASSDTDELVASQSGDTRKVSPTAECQIFYPYGSTQIGRGDAVTDNFSTIGWPAGWNMAGDLGSAWTIDFPVQATSYGVPLSSTAM